MRFSTKDYIDQCNIFTKEYIEGVKSGHIIVGKYIKKLVSKYERLKTDPLYIHRQDKVEKVFAFFSFLNTEHKNQYVQFPLLPWQTFFISYVFGFYYNEDINKRLVREAFLFIGRKNGKTAFASAIQLYGMLGDNVVNPQSLLLANTSQQASISLNFAKSMIIHTPVLKERLQGQRSRIIFKDIERQGFCQIFSTVEPARLEGMSPSHCIMDEIHNWTDNTIYQSVKTGIGARVNPLILIITTAGNKNLGFCNDYLKYHKNILDGNISDDTITAFIYQPDEEDDLTNYDNWVKANPSVTFINSFDDLITSFKQAQYSYADKYAFLTKNLNIFVDTPDVWIPEEALLPCFQNFDDASLYGRDAYIGMDLSKNVDLSSITLYIPDASVSYVIPYFWMANMEGNVIRANGRDLSHWIFDGFITKCESRTIDIDLIYNKIIELSQKFNIISIQYDPYNTPVLISRLKDYGLNCEIFKQNASKFNAPMKMLEEKIYNKTIIMKNPVLLWNFSNVVLWIDSNANIKIIKNKQNDSVDGCVALAMGIGGWITSKYGEEILGINQYIDAAKK